MSDLPTDFGDVAAEYWAARSGHGLGTGTLDLVWARGEDTLEFLDGQVTQDLAAMPEGSVRRSLLLGPRGKLLAVMWVLRAGPDRAALAVDAGLGPKVIDRLEEFRFRVDVEFELDERPIHELWGGESPVVAGHAGLDPGGGWVDAEDRTVALLQGRVMPRVLVAGDPAPLFGVGVVPVGRLALSAVRIEAGEPVMGVDLDESVIPQESGLVEESVSFTKGCYVGQELVARIDSRGRVNRRLAGVVMTTNLIPPVGADVVHEGDSRGTVSRTGESLALRAPVAWGLVRREVGDGDEVEVRWEGGSAPAVLRSLPLDDFSEPAHTPLTLDTDLGDDLTGA